MHWDLLHRYGMRFQACPKMDNRFSESNRKRETPVDDIDDERVFKLRKKMVGIELGELRVV